nr:MAG TPA: hypothetical protein [Caudoviricetes sp.]
MEFNIQLKFTTLLSCATSRINRRWIFHSVSFRGGKNE